MEKTKDEDNIQIVCSEGESCGCASTRKELVDLTGHWFVYFGVEVVGGKMEGSRILTLNGRFDADALLDILTSKVEESLPDDAKELLRKNNQKIVVRSFNRIDAVGGIGAQVI